LYRDQHYDYNEALRLLGSDVGQGLSVDTTPSSWRCALDNPNELFSVQKEFKGYPGINDVVGPTQQVRSMEKVIHVLQWVFLGVAVILLLSASVLILNTIRLAIFARRREVSVMKLVGATNWFIRVPFMCEGLIQGMLGALVAAAAVFGLHWILNDLSSNRSSFLFQMRMPTGEAMLTCLVVLIIGVVIGSLGSALGIRRFLDA
jgi:cell division transport system permease protein